MARDRKGFNAKARKGKKVQIDDSATKQIAVDSKAFETSKYDESNALVLPSKKRKTRIHKDDSGQGHRFLSNKQRKKLKQIVVRRGKKSERADLLVELQKHQLSAEIFAKLTPLVQVQTEGLKKLFSQQKKDQLAFENGGAEIPQDSKDNKGKKSLKISNSNKPTSSIKGANKMKFRSWSGRFSGHEIKGVDKVDPKVLGFDDPSSSEEESEEEPAEDVEIKVEPQDDMEADDGTSDEDMDQDDDDEVVSTKAEIEHPNGGKTTSKIPLDKPKTDSLTKGKKISEKLPLEVELTKAVKKEEVEIIAVRVTKTFVRVNRTKEIEAIRSKLPIIPEEQVIMESVTDNLVTVLAGETGSGKTTQVPQFLYEAGYTLNGKLIGVTEPRRVAAIAMSHRVAKELNLSTDVVSYQIRFDGNVSPKTQIKFMTDGVLLKEMERDFLLSKYSAICIDEAHERSLYTDILIGLLSRCVSIRKKRNDPLKLIIMSATMRVEDFVENSILFKTPPSLIHVPTRQFPVQIHFSKVTPENYLVAAYKKTVQIHRKLPPGGILIFLTGQQEVKTLVNKLRQVFPFNASGSNSNQDADMSEEANAKQGRGGKNIRKRKGQKKEPVPQLKSFDLDKIQAMPLKAEEDSEDEGGSDDEFGGEELDWDTEITGPSEPLYVLPLYSMLPNKEQQRVFEPPTDGSRLCVVATNVAETSLTIPSIRYVVDCGKVKLKVWDKLTGVQQFKISWESKASAEQRSGRAGRTGPGHSYRLYSSAVFDSDFEKYSVPEIQVRPVDDMVLLMKSMSIDRVQNFPYPTHPGETQLISAEKILLALGALETSQDSSRSKNVGSKITQLGKTMSHFPLGPRFSKMLALSFHHDLVEFAVALVSALTVQEVFLDASLHETSKEVKSSWSNIRRKWAGTGPALLLGDCMVLLRAVGAFEYEGGTPDFCVKKGLRFKAMSEIRKLRKQLTSEINLFVNEDEEVPLNPQMNPPTDKEATLLRQIILSGLPDRIARRVHDSEIKEGEDPKIYRYAYRCGELEDSVFIHPSSVLRTARPDWIVYQEIFESDGKMYLRGITGIEPSWIPVFCKSLCRTDTPLQDPPPFYCKTDGTVKCSVKATYGKQGWELPILQVEYPRHIEKFKLFSQFLLEGEVFSKLAQWRPRLLSLPVTMTKSWAKLQPRTQTFLTALTSQNISKKSDLETQWKDNKNFLLQEFLEWIPQEIHSEVIFSWPPLD